jgi:uncharacterized protein
LLLGVFLLIVWALRGGRRSNKPTDSADAASDGAPENSPVQKPAREDIVACVHCGVHLPQSEAVAADAGWFCGQPHRIAHEKSTPK